MVDIANVYEVNGFSDDQDPADVTYLELVMSERISLACLSEFKNIKSLCLVNQRLQSIEAIAHFGGFKLLERIWLNENKISDLQPLSTCPQLREVYFSFNNVQTFGTSVHQLSFLTVLCGSGNRIDTLAGIPSNVESLDLAGNLLTSTDLTDAPYTLPSSLKYINLAGNVNIDSLQAVCRLIIATLPSLEELYFKDNDWGECAVVQMSQYRSWIVAIGNLKVLDGLNVSEEEKIEATLSWESRKLYYTSHARNVHADYLNAVRGAPSATLLRLRDLIIAALEIEWLSGGQRKIQQHHRPVPSIDSLLRHSVIRAKLTVRGLWSVTAPHRSDEIFVFREDGTVIKDSLIATTEVDRLINIVGVLPADWARSTRTISGRELRTFQRDVTRWIVDLEIVPDDCKVDPSVVWDLCDRKHWSSRASSRPPTQEPPRVQWYSAPHATQATLEWLRSVGWTEDECRIDDSDRAHAADVVGHMVPLPFTGRLQILRLTHCRLSRLDFELPGSLVELSVDFNELTSLNGLQRLLNVKRVSAVGNRISELSNLPAALTFLAIDCNPVNDSGFSGIDQLTMLEALHATNTLMTDQRVLLSCKSLTRLKIADFRYTVMSGTLGYRDYAIFHLTSLRYLDGEAVCARQQKIAKEMLEGYLTRDMLISMEKKPSDESCSLMRMKLRRISADAFTFYNKLTELVLAKNSISDVSGIGQLPSLVSLSLAHNKLGDLGAVGALVCPNLKFLDLSNNHITDLSRFSTFLTSRHLKILRADGNALQCVAGALDAFTELEEVSLQNNKLRTLEGLPSGLKELFVDSNALKTLDGLERLKRLRLLHASGNRLGDFQALQSIRDSPKLINVNLAQNPLNRMQLYRLSLLRVLPNVAEIDGQTVTESDKAKIEEILFNQSLVAYN